MPLLCFTQINHDYGILQNPFARFSKPFSDKKLPLGKILDICQDSRGYMWIAGTKGLMRFDGTRQNYYYHVSGNPFSLPSNEITSLATDFMERLWIGSSKGLSLYDYDNDRFINMLNGNEFAIAKDSLSVRSILCEGDSLIWLDMLNGYLWKIDILAFRVIKRYQHSPTFQSYYHYNTVWRSPGQKIWVGGRGFGPYFINDDDELEKLATQDTNLFQKRESDFAVFHTDPQGINWVGGLDGLYQFNESTHQFYKILPISTNSICQGHNGGMWIGTGHGLFRYDHKKKQLLWHKNNEDDPNSIPEGNVYVVYTDLTGKIWIGCDDKVVVHNPNNSEIQFFFHIPGQKNSPASSSITSLEYADDGKIWIGTRNKGLDLFDIEKRSFEHFHTGNVKGMPSSNIRCILKTNDGNIYCGLWAGKGFGLLNPRTRIFKNYSLSPNTLVKDWYNDLAFDINKNLYLGFWGANGLMKFNTKKEEFGEILMSRFADTYHSRLITCLHQDNYGSLWVGTTQSGIHRYSPSIDTSRSYYTEIDSGGGYTSAIVHDITFQNNGRLYASGKGLFMYDLWQDKFIPIEFSQPYRDIEIFAIVNGKNDNIWLLSEKGLLLFNSFDESLTDYSKVIPIDFEEKNCAGLLLDDGYILVGGTNGLAHFNPEKTNIKSTYPNIYPSVLTIFDQTYLQSFPLRHKINLRHDQNFINLHFGSDQWGKNDPYIYEAMLQNFDREWNVVSSTEKTIHYTNIPPGTYFLRVRASDIYGLPGPTQIVLEINIAHPYYNTWWFISITGLLMLIFIGLMWKFRMNQVKEKLLYLENDMKLLRVQMNPHFIFNSLAAIQNYIYTHKTHLAGQYLSDFASLIRNILDNSRFEYIGLDKELETVDVYLKLQQHRFQTPFKFTVKTEPEFDPCEYFIPPMMVQPFLENAIEHGIKNINKQGEITLTYSLNGKIIRIELQDNGIGLNASKAMKSESGDKTHESVAIKLFNKRHQLLQKKHKMRLFFSISDIINDDNQIAGTRIVIDIPHTYQPPKNQ